MAFAGTLRSTLGTKSGGFLNEAVQVRTGAGIKKVEALIPAPQKMSHPHLPIILTQTFNNIPINLLRNAGAKCSLTISKGAFLLMKDLELRINITVNNSPVTLAAVTYWFTRINLLSQGRSDPLATWYNDTAHFNLCALTREDAYACMAKIVNMDTGVLYGQGASLPVGNYVFRLPLLGTFFDSMDLYFQNANADLVLDLYPDQSGVCIAGTNANVDCTGIFAEIDSDRLTPEDELFHQKAFADKVFTYRYVDPIQVNNFSKTLTAGSPLSVDLSTITGKITHLLAVVRATGATNVGNAYMNYINLGDDHGTTPATIDVVAPGSKSILGSGSPISTKLLRDYEYINHFGNSFGKYKSIYFIPLCECTMAAYKGQANGWLELPPGHSYSLNITPGAALTQEVQTITCTQTNTAGAYRVSFRGEFTNPLAYNATAATIQTAVNGLRNCLRDNIVITASGPLSATATFTVGTGCGIGTLSPDLFQVVSSSLNASGTYDTPTTTITTQCNGGFTTGSYDITIYAYKYRVLSVFNGQYSTYDY